MRTLITHAHVVRPSGIELAHVLMDSGSIVDVGCSSTTSADEVVNAAGLHLLPGVVDDQVHFRDPGLTHKEDLYTASLACARGGVTSFLEMPNTIPTTTTQGRLEAKLALASKKSIVNYGFYMGATAENLAELRVAHRTPGIKIFIGSSTGDLLVDEQEALERIFAETTLPLTAHCEDEATIRTNRARLPEALCVEDHSRIRDDAAAWVATQRALDLARRHRHRFHVLHVSTAAETALIADADGLITGEACPHHLFFHTGDYERLGTRVQMNPSIKGAENHAGLWQALRDGHLQVVATDHAPHLLREKDRPYPQSPSGLPAVENSLSLMLDAAHRGLCTLEQVVAWMCDAPARVWDMIGKGRLEPGYDADLVLVDLNAPNEVRDDNQVTRCKWTPWHGETLMGQVVRTWVGGREVYREGAFDTRGRGAEVRFDHDLGGYWSDDRRAS